MELTLSAIKYKLILTVKSQKKLDDISLIVRYSSFSKNIFVSLPPLMKLLVVKNWGVILKCQTVDNQ